MVTTVLFDLDGTLLPMDNDEFTKYYFKLLAADLVPMGYDPKTLIDAVWAGTSAMVKNNGSRPNEEAFWECFGSIVGEKALADKEKFMDFYRYRFAGAKAACGFNPLVPKLIADLKAKGTPTALATNPIFPEIATLQRIEWAGISADDFKLYTVYENIGFCKPNLDYYREVCRRLGKEPSECIMVGNDADEDMIAEELGMQVFLITDNLINRSGKDISQWKHGSFADLCELLREWSLI